MQRAVAVREPLGALMPGPHPLEGKSFYLDEVKSHSCGVLTKLIIRLGGKVESFLYKDVNIVITGNRDALTDVTASSGKVKGHDVAQRPRAPVCGSRGKALLEKAIGNNEQFQGGALSSAARYWGVKIVSVDQFMKVVGELSSHRSTHTHRRREEKNSSECSSVRVIKAGSLKVDFIKVEDSSRKYRPLHGQRLDFPMLSYTRRFSPFENPAPVQPGKTKADELGKDRSRKSEAQVHSQENPSATPSPKMSRKKRSSGFCECCQIKYKDQDEHLESDVHRRFVEDVNNYAVVDQLVVAMEAVFSGCKDPQFDALTTRLSSGSAAPPSETERWRKSETEPACSVEIRQGCVRDSPVLQEEPQEPRVEAPPHTSSANKLNSTSKHKTCTPSPRPQDAFVSDSRPLEHAPPTPDVHQPNAPEELVETCPGALPVRETSLKEQRGSSDPSDGPEHDLAACTRVTEREREPLVDPTSYSPSSCSLPSTTTFSEGVNPRKRSRSLTLSPKASKMRRTNLWSDPINQNVRLDEVHRHVISGHTEADDVTAGKPSLVTTVTPEDRSSFQNDRQVPETFPDAAARDVSSELGPPRLYPFFHDDVYQNRLLFLDPPQLAPSVPFPSANRTSGASLPSPSVRIESALVPDTFSPASSESDWDSGLLSRFAPPVHLQSKGGRCELDLGLLLQSSCAGMQDGSYASHLCSVLQPADVGDPDTIYWPMEPVDRRMIQSLGV
ncbi:hypothetical protein AMELA_G00107570 [Ameiurus melas]|uniref:DBF4-type domain-containing protein n=1 Tax=Ameiurus melas TaxID=219545 RepID=A0A7J6AP67_AMEME|nr:hypothetical protein AMELA_G00107570 [Ameiurus melas]